MFHVEHCRFFNFKGGIMKKTGLIVLMLLISTTVYAETWRVTWAEITNVANPQAQAPSSYYNSTYGASTSGVPVGGKSDLTVICYTTGTGADTDFNFHYDGATVAFYSEDDVGANTNFTQFLTLGGDFLTISADNDGAAAVTPYCDVKIW